MSDSRALVVQTRATAGRPSDYSDAWANKICDWVGAGNTLASFCAFSTHPAPSTVYRWLKLYPAFSEMFAHARESLTHVWAEQVVDIADTTQTGQIVTRKSDGTVEVKIADMIEHRRLRVEARKWATAAVNPSRYGQRQTVRHEGSVGGAQEPLSLTPEQAERVAREMLIQQGYEFGGA